MQAFLLGEKKLTDLPDEGAAPQEKCPALSDYLFKTSLFSVISALPLCCREMVMASDGVLFQLALLALVQAEKGQKKLHVAKYKGKKNKLVVQLIIKKIKKEMGVIRKKVKRIKSKLKEEKKTKNHVVRLGQHQSLSKTKRSVIKKKFAIKIKAKKKPSKLLRKIKIKAIKAKKSKVHAKMKMSAKRLAKLSIPKMTQLQKVKGVARKSKSALKRGKLKIYLKKRKLSFLIKPDGKMMGKVARKHYAKQRNAQFMKLGLLQQKRERGRVLLAQEKAQKSKVANAPSFFKKSEQYKTDNKATTTKRKVMPGFKNIVKANHASPNDMKNSA